MRARPAVVFHALLALTLATAAAPAVLADSATPPPGKDGKDAGSGKAPAPRSIVATLDRTACFGTCPAYRLTIWSDGRVEWEGRSFVKVKGRKTATLTEADLKALRAAFAEARYFDLGEGFDCYEMTDNPSATTSYQEGGRSRTIRHYHGCRSKEGAATLSKLEDRIDAITGTARWVGTQAERDQLEREGRLRN